MTRARDLAAFVSNADGDIKFDTDTLFIDSSENRVGISTNTPSGHLHVYENSTAGSYIFLENTDGSTRFQANNDAIYIDAEAHVFRDSVAGGSGEYMRVDSSGNLLVGKTSADSGATAGIETNDNGRLNATRDGSVSGVFNRLTSDGDIAQFRKDGTTVGSIGAKSGDIYIGTGDTGIRFNDGDNAIYAANTSPYSASDGNISLGVSAARFNNLYLSGGAYLGGTAAANALDDYEEGTWTPACSSFTIDSASGKYIKIGKILYVQGRFRRNDTSVTTTNVAITGLPFTVVGAASASPSDGAWWCDNGSNTSDNTGFCYTGSASGIFFAYHTNTSQNSPTRYLQENDINNLRGVSFNFTAEVS